MIVSAAGEMGRRDKYVDKYTGREYGGEEIPLEVISTGVQQMLHPVHGEDYLTRLLRNDPEMADLVLGVLFGYDP